VSAILLGTKKRWRPQPCGEVSIAGRHQPTFSVNCSGTIVIRDLSDRWAIEGANSGY
jgi:hypothetical protein